MSPYRVRMATTADADTLVAHRVRMFEDMGIAFDRDSVVSAFTPWLHQHMAEGLYVAWLVEHVGDGGSGEGGSGNRIIGGGGLSVLPWPPGPRHLGARLGYVYNVFTEPDHRRRGVGRVLMAAIHEWCRQQHITSLALNASDEGRPLYEAIGYRVATSPMMFLALP